MDRQEAIAISMSLWDEDADAWRDRWAPVWKEFADEVVRRAALRPGERVLDVGTATGNALLAAARAVAPEGRAVGVDASGPMVGRTRLALQAAGLNANVLQMDARSLEFPDGWFNAVVSSCGVMSESLREIAGEVRRVLKPGGRFVWADWCFDKVAALRIFGDVLAAHRTAYPSAPLRRQREAMDLLTPEVEALCERTSLEAALRRAGFASVKGETISHTLRSFTYDSFIEARLARTSIRREVGEMTAEARDAFRGELRRRLAHLEHDGAFEILWPMYYITATK